jgi:MFS family permease
MMIPHHQGAIEMAKVELQFGVDPVLRRLAQEIIVTQKSEIDVMNLALKKYPLTANEKTNWCSQSMCGVLLLVLSSSYHGLLIFLAANALAGIGYSLSFTGGLNLLNAHAPPHHRGGTLSALFLIAYLIQGATALLLVVATTWGLKTSIELGSMTLGFLGALVAALAFSGRGINPPARSFEQSRHMSSTF